jgi:hypothetical protein
MAMLEILANIVLLNEDFVLDNTASPPEGSLFDSPKYSFLLSRRKRPSPSSYDMSLSLTYAHKTFRNICNKAEIGTKIDKILPPN